MCILIVPQQNTGFILDSDMEGKNEESYKFPIAVQQSFNSLWSQDVRGDPDSGIGGHWRSSDSGMYKFILILRALAVFRFRRALAVFRFRHAFTKNGIACIYLEGKSTRSTCADSIADMNMLANDVPAEQAHAIAPPTRTDDQIFPSSKWVPIGKNVTWMSIVSISTKIIPQNHSISLQPIDDNPFVAPPSSDTVLEYVNTLGYPSTLRNVSAILLMLSSLWVLIHSSISGQCWKGFREDLVQSIQTFLTDRKNLATASRGKKKTAHLLIPSVRYKRRSSNQSSPKLPKVTKPKAAKVTKPAGDKATKPTSTQTPKPKPTPTQPSKAIPEKK
ncbi:hypothetical protein Tco_0907824 [Tanacetum coccineum]|uniref:Uncharacterized protein n=1 Tax=Tanacetum coccineum TaxID=301880 RepID=A0ABQ5CRU7_9ASTR